MIAHCYIFQLVNLNDLQVILFFGFNEEFMNCHEIWFVA